MRIPCVHEIRLPVLMSSSTGFHGRPSPEHMFLLARTSPLLPASLPEQCLHFHNKRDPGLSVAPASAPSHPPGAVPGALESQCGTLSLGRARVARQSQSSSAVNLRSGGRPEPVHRLHRLSCLRDTARGRLSPPQPVLFVSPTISVLLPSRSLPLCFQRRLHNKHHLGAPAATGSPSHPRTTPASEKQSEPPLLLVPPSHSHLPPGALLHFLSWPPAFNPAPLSRMSFPFPRIPLPLSAAAIQSYLQATLGVPSASSPANVLIRDCGNFAQGILGALGVALALAVRALAVTTFFKKSFKARSHLPQVLLLFLSTFLLSGWASVLPILYLLLAHPDEPLATIFPGIPTESPQDAKNYAAALCWFVAAHLFTQKWKRLALAQRALFLALAWWAVPSLSIFQLARKPEWLKNKLRPLRVALGPVSILTAAALGIAHCSLMWDARGAVLGFTPVMAQTEAPLASAHLSLWLSRVRITGITRFVLSATCTVCSVLAGFLFRPDNAEMLELLRVHRGTYKSRARVHGTLNMIAVLCSCLLCWPPALGTVLLGTVLGRFMYRKLA